MVRTVLLKSKFGPNGEHRPKYLLHPFSVPLEFCTGVSLRLGFYLFEEIERGQPTEGKGEKEEIPSTQVELAVGKKQESTK